ncbi:MAG: type II secretion system F family protein [Victivallaceae bacterium]|nr:type II secretion system F family protein [Victivallaceae bacterium]
MINEFELHNFSLPALSDKAHMHLHGYVSDLTATLAWAVKHDIPFLEALAEYVPKNKKWGPPVSYAKMGKKSFLDINIIGRMPWQRFMDKLKDGQPLSSALSEFKRQIPNYILMAIKEAETKNNLKITLPLLAERLHDTESSARDWKTTLAYPLVQLTTMAFIITGLMIFIIPNFTKIFDDLLQGEPLPEVTQLVINTSFFVKEHFSIIVFIVIILFSLLSITSRRGLLSSILFPLPFIGRRVKLFVLYDIAKSMSCFMTTGNDILYAAESTMHCQKCIQARMRLKKFIAAVRAGSNWVDAWERHMNLGSPIHLWMLRNAASREKVAEGFVHLQNWLGEELHFFSSKFKSVCELFLTLGNAIIVGTIVIALFMPLTRIIWALA